MLAAENVVWQAGKRAIVDIEALRIAPGEVLAVIGPNGSGKSSLLKILACLQKPTSGRVLLKGEDVYACPDPVPIRRKMAVVFQDALLLRGTVRYNVEIGLRLRGTAAPEREERTAYWLEQFGVGHLAEQPVRYLSGGEAQRVSLARAFAVQPEVLFLDEPFASLDTPTRGKLLDELGQVLRETGLTTVFVSHDYTEVSVLADRVAAIIDGRLVQADVPARLFSRPRTAAMAAFVGVENVIPARMEREGEAITENGLPFSLPPETAAGKSGYVCFRGEDVRLTPAISPGSEKKANTFAGAIADISPRGSKYALTVQCGERLTAVAGQTEYWRLGFRRGQPVQAAVAPEDVFFIAE